MFSYDTMNTNVGLEKVVESPSKDLKFSLSQTVAMLGVKLLIFIEKIRITNF